MNNNGTEPADSFGEDAQRLIRQPTAEEVSRLTYGARDLRVFLEKDASNDFAHLLNRGSPLE
jgi:hypothetical protein